MEHFIAYYNGQWMPFGEVRVHPQDRGFTVGDVVFDVERTFDGKSFRMREHIDRLYRSLKYVRIDPRHDRRRDAGPQRGGHQPQRAAQGPGRRLQGQPVGDPRHRRRGLSGGAAPQSASTSCPSTSGGMRRPTSTVSTVSSPRPGATRPRPSTPR